jgi:hypothetical protein
MTSEQRRWAQLRERAETYLPADFAKRVVSRAQNDKRSGWREYVLIGVTAAFCLASVAVANWYIGNIIQQKNLALWSVTEAQIGALRRTI